MRASVRADAAANGADADAGWRRDGGRFDDNPGRVARADGGGENEAGADAYPPRRYRCPEVPFPKAPFPETPFPAATARQ